MTTCPARANRRPDRIFRDARGGLPGKFGAEKCGMTPRIVDLLKEIAELKQILAARLDEKKKAEIERKIQPKQVELSLIVERQKYRRQK